MTVANRIINGAPIDSETLKMIGKFAAATVMGAAAATTMKRIPATPSLRSEVGSRYTIIGFDNASAPQLSFNVGDESFLNVIERDLLGVNLIHSLPENLPFYGGWMGYIGFEALEQESSSSLPDAMWTRPEQFFIHDREESRTFVVSLSTDPGQLQHYITGRPRASNATIITGE